MDATRSGGYTALMEAACEGHLEIVEVRCWLRNCLKATLWNNLL